MHGSVFEAGYIVTEFTNARRFPDCSRYWSAVSREINLRSTISTAGGARAWAVLLAKTSRTAVPTAIMPIIAGGRLYKCLSKMHVDSRAFWGAFWGAFQVFLSEPG